MKLKSVVAASAAFLASGSVFASEPTDVSSAVGAFTTFVTTNLPLVGAALVGGAAIAVGWKWIKGMMFS